MRAIAYSKCAACITSCIGHNQIPAARNMVKLFERLYPDATVLATCLRMHLQRQSLHLQHVEALSGLTLCTN
jgi:hypothetical protein